MTKLAHARSRKTNQLLSLFGFPAEVRVLDGWDIVLLPSEYDSLNNCGYVPTEMIEIFNGRYKGSDVIIGSGDFGQDCELLAIQSEWKSTEYAPTLFDDYYDQTGCWVFAAEFVDRSILLGCEKEYIFLLSPSASGLIASSGGLTHFKTLNERIYKRGRSDMPEEAFWKATNAVYGNL